MIITNELIEQLKTAAGGWTKESLALMGVDWPPQKGWKERIIGNEMDERTFAQLQRIIKEQESSKKSAQQNLF